MYVRRSLRQIWEALAGVRRSTVEVTAGRLTMRGSGIVSVEPEPGGALIFRESGVWDYGPEFSGTRFTDVLRWTLDPTGDGVHLEHLRRGTDRPVPLVHLTWSGVQLESVAAHRCGHDLYSARLRRVSGEVELEWTVRGPGKGYVMVRSYPILSPAPTDTNPKPSPR